MSSTISLVPSNFSTMPSLSNLSTAAPIATPVVITPPLNTTLSWLSAAPHGAIIVYDPNCGCHRTVVVPTPWIAPNTTAGMPHPTTWAAPNVSTSPRPSASSTLATANAGNMRRNAGWVTGLLALGVGILGPARFGYLWFD